MFKKFLSTILCLSLLVGSCISSFAAQITNNNSQDVVVTYGMDESFLVVIPTDFTIGGNNKATADISATNVVISYGSVLKVSMSSNNYVSSWELVDVEESMNSLTYIVGSSDGADDIKNNSVVLSVNSGEAHNSTITKTMYFEVIDEITKSGVYKDTLTFNVFVERNESSSDEEPVLDVVGEIGSGNEITLSSELNNDIYTLKYENTEGPLTNYADICTLESGGSYDGFIDENIAPLEATKIGVYGSSGDRVGSIQLVSGLRNNYGAKLYSFGALSDAHVGYGDENYANALAYLSENEDISFITVAGDLTDSCTEWEDYQTIVNTYSNGIPIYESVGNHDTAFWYGKTNGYYNDENITEYTDVIKTLIETYTGDSLYYSFTIGNDVFIMFGVQSNYGGRMFSQESLQWLYETLEANKDKRCFVFEHVLPDGASGNANGWANKEDMSGTEQEILVSLLKHYQNVTLFHGHTHQTFRLQEEADDATYDNYLGINSIHIPSVGGTRGTLSVDSEGSQGYVIDVYSNGIVLKGIDFLSEKYLPIAHYYLDTSLKSVKADTYIDNTNTINCEKVVINWTHETHINKTSGQVEKREDYSSSDTINIESGKKYYFHTLNQSPYQLDIICYDSSGVYIGYFSGPWSGDRYSGPIELNSLLLYGTASIKLRMWTGTDYDRKTAPIFITAIESENDVGGSDSNKYTNMLETVGYFPDKRISGSTGVVVDNIGTYVSGLISVKNGDIIRFKNIKMPVDGGNYKNNIALYLADGSYYVGYELLSSNPHVHIDSDGNIISYIIDHGSNDISFLRISAELIDDTSIVTVNELIQ